MRVILVVEDNESSRFVIRAVLEQRGYAVLEASNAEEAVSICRRHNVELLIADAMLGDVHGPEIAQQVRRFAPGMPIVYVSGFPREELEHRGVLSAQDFQYGPVRFLQKPFMPKTLMDVVEDLLRRGRAAKATPGQ